MKAKFFLFPLIFTALFANSVTAGSLCGSRDSIVSALEKEFSERPVARGLTLNGAMFEFFVSQSGTFTILATDARGRACLITAGESLEALTFKSNQDS